MNPLVRKSALQGTAGDQRIFRGPACERIADSSQHTKITCSRNGWCFRLLTKYYFNLVPPHDLKMPFLCLNGNMQYFFCFFGLILRLKLCLCYFEDPANKKTSMEGFDHHFFIADFCCLLFENFFCNQKKPFCKAVRQYTVYKTPSTDCLQENAGKQNVVVQKWAKTH